MGFTDKIEVDAANRFAEATLRVNPQAEYLTDHFPEMPVLPGLLMLEAAVRAASALWREIENEGAPRVAKRRAEFASLARVERMSVSRRVAPDEVLIVRAEMIESAQKFNADNAQRDERRAMFAARAFVGGETAMRARFALRRASA